MLSPVGTCKAVAFFLHGIGDGLLALPALRALSSLFCERLALVCAKEAYELVFHELRLGACIFPEFRPSGTAEGFDPRETSFDADGVAAELGGCDMFLALVPWQSPGLRRLAEALRPSKSIALSEGYDLWVPRQRGVHAFDHAFHVAQVLDAGLEISDFAGPPQLPRAASRRAADIAGRLPPDTKLLVIHNETGPRKVWDSKQLLRVVGEFLHRHPEVWAVTLGLQRMWTDADICDQRIVPCEGMSIAPSIALIGSANLFLGVDSCMLHAADLWRVPGVGLFGPTRASEFGFRFARHGHLESPDRTMSGIGRPEVLALLESVYEHACQQT